VKAAKSEHGGVSASIKARTKSKEITIQDALREKSQGGGCRRPEAAGRAVLDGEGGRDGALRRE
jgi:hypothetical protein